MALYIFSDAHLGSGSGEGDKQRLSRIRQLFDMVTADGDRLIILGDLFDFWFEYKHAIPKGYTEILLMLKQLAMSGLKIDYVSGNHDFWMGDYFDTEIGVKLHRDNLETEFLGKKLFLTHGDGLSSKDIGYRFIKPILRNRFNIWLYRKLPPDWGIPLAKFVSGTSRDYTSKRDHTFALEYESFAKSKLSEGFDCVLIGHLHIPVYKEFESGIYINTGDFISHFSYVVLDDNGIRLEYLK